MAKLKTVRKEMTRTIARKVAYELASMIYDKKIEDAEKSQNDLAMKLLDTIIPKPIIDGFNDHPDFFESSSRAIFVSLEQPSSDIQYRSSFGSNKPAHLKLTDKSNPFSCRIYEVSWEDYLTAVKLEEEYMKLFNAKSEYINKVDDVLYSLKYLSNISASFPEAYDLVKKEFEASACSYSQNAVEQARKLLDEPIA